MAWQPSVLTGRDFAAHLEQFRGATAGAPPIVWEPDEATRARANLTALMADVGASDYAALHRWSVTERAAFWDRMRRRLGFRMEPEPATALDLSRGVADPVWFPGARMNAAAACFQAPPDAVAIVHGAETGAITRVTYGELHDLCTRVAGGLRALGLREGDGVALFMPMTIECVAAYLGAVMAGLSVVSVPDSFAAPEVITRLRLGDAKVVVTVEAFQRGGKRIAMVDRAREAADAVGARLVVAAGGGAADAARGGAGGRAGGTGGTGGDAGLSWKDLLGEPAEPVMQDPYATTNVLFSSGTTGEPKAIPWTHLTPLKAAADGHLHQDIHADDVVAWPTNIGWMMGPWLIYATLVNGATMALYDGAPNQQGFLDFVRHARVSVLGVVPALVRAWRAAGVPLHSLPDVRVFSSTGEASNQEDYLYLMSLASYRAPVIEYCGGTEVGGGHITGTVLQPASPATFTTAAMGLDFVILDDGQPVPEGGLGELFLVPPSVGLSQRLLNRDHHEEYYAGCRRGPHGEVLRRHGDEMRRLPGGFYAAAGRADDTMNLGGIKVSSVELERAMDGHEAVRETAAVGVPPPGGGADRLVVFVVPDEPAAAPAAAQTPVTPAPALLDPDRLREELQARIRARLNPLFRIADVVVVESLPRTASNKVMRRALRAQYE